MARRLAVLVLLATPLLGCGGEEGPRTVPVANDQPPAGAGSGPGATQTPRAIATH